MAIVSLVSQKGGVGKTTLSTHLAAGFARKKKRVLLVDADPQSSALDWEASRSELGLKQLFTVIGMPKKILHVELPKMQEDYDMIVIDAPPRVYDVARSAVTASDLVLIPVQPSPYDVWASEETVELVQECANYKPSLQCAYVINRRIVNTAIARGVSKALSQYPFGILKATICQRVVFAESASQGKTVFEKESDSPACKEIEALVREVGRLVG